MALVGFLLICSVNSSFSHTSPNSFHEPVQVKGPSLIRISQNSKCQINVDLVIEHGYHLVANPPSDKNLVPTQIDFQKSNDLKINVVQYPKGKTLWLSGLGKNWLIYEAEINIPVELRSISTTDIGSRKLSALLRYQACTFEKCLLPRTIQFEMKLDIVKKGQIVACHIET